jgi:hypothetical protein
VTVLLHLPSNIKAAIWSHLLRADDASEAAAFAFVTHGQQDRVDSFDYLEWYAVPPEGFDVRTGYHIELTDETRAIVIKRAHDLESSLVEFHSHLGPWPAAFSGSDEMGLAEFVPHARWRLRGRPYLAIVTTPRDYDGLVWIAKSAKPERLDGIVVDEGMLPPTGLSSLEYGDDQ